MRAPALSANYDSTHNCWGTPGLLSPLYLRPIFP